MSNHDHTNPSSAEPIPLDHEVDGIREYDNALPGWWTGIFWATIIYSMLYPMYYHWGVGPSVHAELDSDMTAAAEAQLATLGPMAVDEATIVSLGSDPKKLLIGRAMFRTNCAVCHGADGGGGVGPNLCDSTYINIKAPMDFFTIIRAGVVAKGMPPWSPRYSDTQILLLAGYVANLRGTTPSTPKPAQGDKHPGAWNTFVSSASPAVPAAESTTP